MFVRSYLFCPFLSLLLTICSSAVAADPIKEMASFSAWKDVPLEKLASGTVLASRGTAMQSPRDLSIELCFIIPKPLPKATEFLQQWSPLKHPELKVYQHGEISMPPKQADFQKLGSAPSNAAVKALVAATQKLGSGGRELQLSDAEAKAFAEAAPGGGGGSMPPQVANFWSNVLFQRSQAFLSGGIGRVPPYEMGKETVRPGEEVARLLKGASKIRKQFSTLVDATALSGGKGSLHPSPYWELINVEDQGTLTLGALYSKGSAETWQAVDAQYYASGGYYAYLTFYQMWPITIEGKESTLVWRGDLISAPSLAELRGVERMGATSAMMKETQKVVSALQKDAAKGQ